MIVRFSAPPVQYQVDVISNRAGVAGAVLQTPLLLINRPGVAGAVLQTASSLIN